MSLDQWEHFFKPEVRSAGRVFVAKGKVSQSRLSDTEIQTYVRASSPFKVTLKSESIDSGTVRAECSCPPSKKGQLCKHMWAALLVVDEKNPDFLEGKSDLQKETATASASPASAARESLKQKQADYRKDQYQKQKARAKERLGATSKRAIFDAPEFPEDVQAALDYFSKNGFELKESLSAQAVSQAMKKLARVFHPDRGGSNDEIVELYKNADILTDFSKN